MDYTHNTYISDKYGLVKIILDIYLLRIFEVHGNQTKQNFILMVGSNYR